MHMAPSAAIILDGEIVELHAGQGIVDAIPSRDASRAEKDAVDSGGSVEHRRGAHMQERGAAMGDVVQEMANSHSRNV